MKKVNILTDSMCHIPASLCQELEIHVIPLPFVWDGRTYLDFDISPSEFYARLRAGASVPTTSGPTPGSVKEHLEQLSKDGRRVLAVLHGRQFSSTYDAATLAAELSPGVDVALYDSASMAMGLGFQVLAAARAAMQGMDLDQILALLERVKGTCGLVFATPRIEYLRLGGRVSHLEGFIASALNLVPILEIRGGAVQALDRVRGQDAMQPRMLDFVADRLDGRPFRLAVHHADAEPAAWNLAAAARERFAPEELFISEITPVLGLHSGPDALGISYCSGI